MTLRLLALAAMCASCTFPDVTFADASVPLDASSESDVASSDAAADVAPPDAGADAVDPCDQDRDGYKATACDGGDCNDHDPRVHPGAGFVTDVPDSGPLPGDWNCDGKVETQYATIKCTAGLACDVPEGFQVTETCGQSGPYAACTGLCSESVTDTRTQGCR